MLCPICHLPCEPVNTETPMDPEASKRMRDMMIAAGAPESDFNDGPLIICMWVSSCCEGVLNDYEPDAEQRVTH